MNVMKVQLCEPCDAKVRAAYEKLEWSADRSAAIKYAVVGVVCVAASVAIALKLASKSRPAEVAS